MCSVKLQLTRQWKNCNNRSFAHLFLTYRFDFNFDYRLIHVYRTIWSSAMKMQIPKPLFDTEFKPDGVKGRIQHGVISHEYLKSSTNIEKSLSSLLPPSNLPASAVRSGGGRGRDNCDIAYGVEKTDRGHSGPGIRHSP